MAQQNHQPLAFIYEEQGPPPIAATVSIDSVQDEWPH